MWKSVRISIPEFRQPNDEVIKVVNDFVKKWNDTNKNIPFEYDFGWDMFIKKESYHVYPFIIKELDELKKNHDVFFHNVTTKHYEEEDFLNTDFTEFASRPIESKTPFILNEKEITPAGGHCPKCGSWSPLTHKSKSPLIIINESLLKNPMDDLSKPDDEEWDLTTAHSHYLISAKFKKILEENKIKGYTLLPTINHKTGMESERMFQLLANKATYVCALPEGVTKQPFCDTCGSAKEIYDFDFAVSKEWIGEDDFFARSDYKGTSLHMSNRVFKLFRQHKLNGLDPLYAVAAL